MVNRSRGLSAAPSTAMRRLSYLRGKGVTQVFHLIEEFSGVTEPHLARFTGEKLSRVEAAIDQLMLGGLLVRHPVYRLQDGELTSDLEYWKAAAGSAPEPAPVFHMHYLSDEGTIIVEHRDLSQLQRIRRRVHEDIRKDHQNERDQLLHTLQLNGCLAALAAAGFSVSAGYRACVYLPGNRQLVPDASMEAALDFGNHVVETVEGCPSDNAFRRRVREQLLKYVPSMLQLSHLEVVYICSSEDAVSIVREEVDSVRREHGASLHAVPLLRGAVRIGPAFEDQPDVRRPLFRPISWLIEYERSAVDPAAIRDKLMPIVRIVQGGHRVAVIFICETELAAQRFEEEH